ncbi:hypothetical protein WJX75_003276 [Coccomyxa subellipsoidea]|uniref:Uncharacterized protein n=1 Tax=Coccomyxa subellipsoidea TaxID=248742 RepID=A0ABR2YPH0_9CHLO
MIPGIDLDMAGCIRAINLYVDTQKATRPYLGHGGINRICGSAALSKRGGKHDRGQENQGQERRESNRQRAERLQQDLNRYHGRDRAKRLEKELLLQRRKYDALVSMFTRAKDELQRMEKSSNSAQAELREMRVERRAQCATHLEALQEKERLTAQLSAAERASAQLRRQLDAARAAGAEACAARSALSQQLAASSGQLTALRHDSADALRRLKLAEAALEAAKEQDRKVIGLSAERGKLAGRCADLEAELAAASSEVDELRQLLDGVMTEKAALAARCSSLESQAHCLEADYGQLRNWLEEVIEEKASLEMRIEDLEGAKEEALEEKIALEGWVRGSVAEQSETCTRLKSFQAQSQEQRAELVTHNALLAALLVRLAQRDAELAERDAELASLKSAMSRQPSLARQQSQKMLRALSVPGARAKPLPPKQEPRLTSALMSPRDCAAAEPCTPSKEPSAPAHAAGRRGSHPSSAATGVDSWVATEHAPSAESSGARKRLCMGEGVSGPSQGPADGVRHTGVTSLEVGAPGQLSSAVSIEANTGKFHSDDEARGPGSTVDAQPDPTNEAAAEQVTSEQLPESWKLKAEKPLSICADCVMPHTPEKHALVQVNAQGNSAVESTDNFSIKARPTMETA